MLRSLGVRSLYHPREVCGELRELGGARLGVRSQSGYRELVVLDIQAEVGAVLVSLARATGPVDPLDAVFLVYSPDSIVRHLVSSLRGHVAIRHILVI